MSPIRITIDPEGDTLIALKLENKGPESDGANTAVTTAESVTQTAVGTTAADAATQTATEPDNKAPTEKQFLCSKKHLTLASRRAMKIFSSNFREASKADDGLYHWTFDAIFSPEAFEIVLKSIHGKTREIPQRVSLDVLAGIATIVDDLECHDSLSFIGKNWLSGFSASGIYWAMNKTLAQLIHASFVFEDAALFEHVTSIAIRYSPEAVPTYDLPIRGDILDALERKRISIFQELSDGLADIQSKLLTQNVGFCSYGCRSMLLGALLQGMNAVGVYPLPSSPFPSLSIGQVAFKLRGIHTPTYFSSEKDCQGFKASGKWTFSSPSTAKLFGSDSLATHKKEQVQGKDKAQTMPQRPFATATGVYGGLSGVTAVPKLNSTPVQGSSSTGPVFFIANTLTAAPFKPHNGTHSSVANTEGQEGPSTLVRHHCCLKDYLNPMLDVVEAKIVGLKLSSFPAP